MLFLSIGLSQNLRRVHFEVPQVKGSYNVQRQKLHCSSKAQSNTARSVLRVSSFTPLSVCLSVCPSVDVFTCDIVNWFIIVDDFLTYPRPLV